MSRSYTNRWARRARAPLLLLLLMAAAPAQARTALRLQDALRAAVEHNPTLGAAIAGVDSAHSRLVAARGLDDPSLLLTSTFSSTRRDLVANLPVQTPAEDLFNGSLSLDQPLPTGGKLSLVFGEAYSNVRSVVDLGNGDRQESTATVYAPSLKLALTHSLLRGLGVGVARADRRRAQVGLDTALLEREHAAVSLLRDVVIAYWNLVYSTQEQAIRQDGVQAARAQLESVRASIADGKSAPSAAAEVAVAIELRIDEQLLARQHMLTSSSELRRLIGPGAAAGDGEVQALDEPVVDLPLPTLPEALELVRERNPERARVRSLQQAAAIEADIARNRLLPQLDVNASAGVIGYASDGGHANRQMFDFKSYSVQAGLVFQEPLGRRAVRGAHEAAVAELRKSELQASASEGQLEAATANALVQLDIARTRAAGLAHAVDDARSDLGAETARFIAGRSSNFDVLRKQQELAEARLRLLRARIDHAQGLAELDALTGQILCRSGIAPRTCDR